MFNINIVASLARGVAYIFLLYKSGSTADCAAEPTAPALNKYHYKLLNCIAFSLVDLSVPG